MSHTSQIKSALSRKYKIKHFILDQTKRNSKQTFIQTIQFELDNSQLYKLKDSIDMVKQVFFFFLYIPARTNNK